MSSKVDMSLEDIIVKNKISGRGNSRGRGRGMRGVAGGAGRGRARGRGQPSRDVGRGRKMGAPMQFRSQRGNSNINGRWSHDMYYGGASAVRSQSSGPTKLNITNLDYGVSDSDIKELFSEFGNMRTAFVHYDRTGRSLGTAHVIFERRGDANKAIKQYNGVHLDGRPMNIEIDGGSGGGGGGMGVGGAGRGFAPGRGFGGVGGRGGFGMVRGVSAMNGARVGPRNNVKRLQGGPRPIAGGRGGGVGVGAGAGRGRGGIRGRGMRGTRGTGRGGPKRGGGRGAPKKVPTAEELDAELEEYTFQASK